MSRPQQPPRARIGLEALETRDCPAASAWLQNGVLTVSGDSASDRIEVRDLRVPSGNLDRWISLGGGTTRVLVNGSPINITVYTPAGHFWYRTTTLSNGSGSPNHFSIWAGGGNDTVIVSTDLTSAAITTRIDGGDGDDYLQATNTRDTITGGEGHDTIYAGEGNDWVDGGNGNDFINGGAGDDALFGGWGGDVIDGWLGNDSLDGGGNGDQLYGADGNDYLHDGGLDAVYDYLHGGNGDDTLIATGGNDVLYGGTGNDTLRGGTGGDYLYGEDGNDTLDGNEDGDQLYGGAGHDYLFGGAGWVYDYLDGGTGDDRLDGGDGDDVLIGNAGWDTLDGGEGNDTLYGDWTSPIADGSPDVIRGGNGNDVIYGGEWNDSLYGHGGNDLIYGDGGNDLIFGGEGHDELSGGEGNDRLFGEGGGDVLFGGIGVDYLNGGLGWDRLYGGGEAGDQIDHGDPVTQTSVTVGALTLTDNWQAFGGGFQVVRTSNRSGTSALPLTVPGLNVQGAWDAVRGTAMSAVPAALNGQAGGKLRNVSAWFPTAPNVTISNAANDGTVRLRVALYDNEVRGTYDTGVLGITADFRVRFNAELVVTVGLVNGQFVATSPVVSVWGIDIDGTNFWGDIADGVYDIFGGLAGWTNRIQTEVANATAGIRTDLQQQLDVIMSQVNAGVPVRMRPFLATANLSFDTATGRITLIL